ncbi:hypothetical protein EI94DRAFT_1602078, partial [Lactarius quietus]
LWVMCYCGPMGYGTQIPAHQIGGQIGLWGIRGYGLSGVCDKRGSTVLGKTLITFFKLVGLRVRFLALAFLPLHSHSVSVSHVMRHASPVTSYLLLFFHPTLHAPLSISSPSVIMAHNPGPRL